MYRFQADQSTHYRSDYVRRRAQETKAWQNVALKKLQTLIEVNPSQQTAGFALDRGEVQVAEAVLVHKRELFCT